MTKQIKKWKHLSTKVIAHNKFFTYVLEKYQLPNKKVVEYYAVRKEHAANMVGVLPDGRVVLVRQYRALFDRISLELPGGAGESTEKPATVARREFLEETGYRAGAVREVGVWATDNSLMDEVVHTFLLTKLKADKKIHDVEEHTELVFLTPKQVDAAIEDGTIWHGQSIIAWHLARPHID